MPSKQSKKWNSVKKALVCSFFFISMLMCVKPTRAETIDQGLPINLGANNLFFYNIEGGAGSSDMILVESNGRWGLIDSGHRYESTISDENGYVWRADHSNLSCQIEEKNGRDGMLYMIETLGVNHLDFIIGTHSHSDHIGGVPEIADILVSTGGEEPHSLINEQTVYFYKTYHHTGKQDDDLGESTMEYSWHNQAYYFQAKEAVSRYGGKLVDISCGIKLKDGDYVSADQTSNLSAVEETGAFSDIRFEARSETNPYDDRLSFTWGDMNIDLYHLYAVDGAKNENVNSIITVIKCGGNNVFLGGDIDTQFQVEQKLARVIGMDHGHFTVAKLSHHGIYSGSNSKEFIDCLQPKIMISTNHWTDFKSPTPGGVYSAVKYYAHAHYGTEFYGVGASDRMLVVGLGPENAEIFNVSGVGDNAILTSAEACRDALRIMDGWSEWRMETISAYNADWYFFKNSKPVTGWNWIESQWYYFESDGVMRANSWARDSYGWCYLGSSGRIVKQAWIMDRGEWYFLKSNGYMAANEWAKDSTDWYWMGANGKISKNIWAKDSVGWCYLGSSGKIERSKWILYKGEWYYLKANGYMAENEWTKDSHGWCWAEGSGKLAKSKWIRYKNAWYYMDASGYMVTGRSNIGGRWYTFAASGELLK